MPFIASAVSSRTQQHTRTQRVGLSSVSARNTTNRSRVIGAPVDRRPEPVPVVMGRVVPPSGDGDALATSGRCNATHLSAMQSPPQAHAENGPPAIPTPSGERGGRRATLPTLPTMPGDASPTRPADGMSLSANPAPRKAPLPSLDHSPNTRSPLSRSPDNA